MDAFVMLEQRLRDANALADDIDLTVGRTVPFNCSI